MDSGDTIEIVQEVYVLRVEPTDSGARVALFSEDRPFVQVDYRFADDERGRHLDTLRHWLDAGLPLTFVRRSGQVALVDERALIQRALA
ncbi:MAG: hypothetical protein ACRD29_06645 [Acidimicrobiales bacterium]